MNVFKTYVLRNLKRNRLRTVMTVLGIILSVALVTAVIEGAFSGLEYVRNTLKATYGDHHGYAINMSKEQENELIRKEELEAYTTFDTKGFSNINSSNSTKPYILVKEASKDITGFLKIKITEGRFPENENEILLSSHLSSNGNVHYNIGDTITIELGERFLEYKDGVPSSVQAGNADSDTGGSLKESPLPENQRYISGEILKTRGTPKTYTVCGIMERLPYTIEDYMCPGYTAIILKTSDSFREISYADYGSVFFRVKDPTSYNDFHNTFEKEHPGVTITKNRELLALYGGTGNYSVTFFMNGFVVVLIGLILFGSVSLVYNSFSISINERTKQIGILKSVGATKRQIRKTYLYEALFDCIVSIPLGVLLGCIGIGTTLFLLQEGFALFLDYSGYSANDVKVSLVLSPALLITAIIIVVAAVFLSAAIPALRASRISPIDLVRQNSDIKIPGKIRKSRLLTKIFGAEGMLASKNYSRNKKRYRSTVISLAVSIILFIAASSFCSYLNTALDGELYTGNVDLIYYNEDISMDSESVSTNNDEFLKELFLSAEGVNKDILVKELYDFTFKDTYDEQSPVNHADFIYIDDDSFNELLRSEGLDPEDYPAEGSYAMVFNKGSYYTYDDESSSRRKVNYEFAKEEELPLKLSFEYYDEYFLPGLLPITQVVDDSGEIYVVFLPTDDTDDYYELFGNEEKYFLAEEALQKYLFEYIGDQENGSEDLKLTREESDMIRKCSYKKRSDLSHTGEINIIGLTYNEDFSFSGSACILLPFSSMSEDLKNRSENSNHYIYSSNSRVSEGSINKLLLENHFDTGGLYNVDASYNGRRMVVIIVNVFSYGFIILISLVSIANVFNTISTNVRLRRREFGMLKSMGLSNKGISKILNIECLIYGVKSLMIGLPLSLPITYLLYRITKRAFDVPFSIPFGSIVITITSVFTVVFITMLYASRQIRRDNTMDALRSEYI